MAMPVEKIEKPETPLGESEIARLIRAASNEAYQKQKSAPQKEAAAFQARSLLDLAQAAATAQTSAVNPTQNEAPKNQPAKAPSAEHVEDAELVEEPTQADETVLDQQENLAIDGKVSQTIEAEKSALPPQEELQATAPTQTAATEQPITAVEEQANISLSDHQTQLAEAEARAFDAGKAAATQEYEENQAQVVATLERAARALLAPDDKATAQMKAVVEAAVIQLASQRAGSQIDANPADFLLRIEKLAERIGNNAKRPIMRLHPEDAMAIKPFLEHSDVLADLRVMPKPALMRGDVELHFDGIRLSDCLSIPEMPQTEPDDDIAEQTDLETPQTDPETAAPTPPAQDNEPSAQ